MPDQTPKNGTILKIELKGAWICISNYCRARSANGII